MQARVPTRCLNFFLFAERRRFDLLDAAGLPLAIDHDQLEAGGGDPHCGRWLAIRQITRKTRKLGAFAP
jgi:hypothetical protein